MKAKRKIAKATVIKTNMPAKPTKIEKNL